MKALLILFFIPVLSFAADVRIFSMNLHCALGNWQERMDAVVAEIIDVNPDVIGLQEVCRNDEVDMATYIRKALVKGGYAVKTMESLDTHRTFVKYQEQLLMISRHDRAEVLKGDLPGVDVLKNGFIALRFGDKWFLTTHLHFALPMIRKSQYRFINDKFGSKKAIIFGDLNSNPANGETSVLRSAEWEPFFDGPTYPSHNPGKTFDGLWMTKSFHDEVISTAMGRHFMNVRNQPSDHLGISLQILFR